MDDRLTGVSDDMIANALRLARGHLSIVIVLLEPIADSGTYDQMMQQCSTLREVNLLIRTASDGKYSLKDATILDVRVLLSKERQGRYALSNDVLEASYNVFQEVVELKSPNVILSLQCQTKTAENVFARKLCSQFRDHVEIKKIQARGHDTIVVRGFHPSKYLNYAKNGTEWSRLRQILTNCFQSAFHALEAHRGRSQGMKCLGQRFLYPERIPKTDSSVSRLDKFCSLR